MRNIGLTIYQTIVLLLLVTVWVLLYIDGYISRFDSTQFFALIFFTITGLLVVGICQYMKNAYKEGQ